VPALVVVLVLLLLGLVGGVRGHQPVRRFSEPVPVLVYHVIGATSASNPLEGLYVTPADLRAQVDWLAHTGWHAVTLDAVLAHWRHGAPLPHKPIVLSFDDGYPGDWRYALPTLRAKHFPGVLNLQIGNLVPLRVRELLRAGWQIASHTLTHPDLTTVETARLRREVGRSRRWLEGTFGVRVDVFCYPFGRYDARVLQAVRRAGYVAAETENDGWASPRDGVLTLDRIRVGAATSAAGLAASLAAARSEAP
jgi:peptidoglycan/xylan/chitin deacetylase (PgdA/CDA1 family)